MKIQTINYENLCENITTSDEAYKLANVVYEPSVIIERVTGLLALFAEKYLETVNDRRELAFDVENRPQIVSALFFSIYNQLKDAETMLIECQNYEVDNEADVARKKTRSA